MTNALLRIDIGGAQALLALLKDVGRGRLPTEVALQSVLKANKYFVDFYCQSKTVTPERLSETIYRCAESDFEPRGPILSALVGGFRRTIADGDRLQAKLDFLATTNPSEVVEHVLTYLPPATPLRSVIHITVDGFNGGFQYQGEIGLSLLVAATDPDQFASGIAHELHHVGFSYWAERDPIRQALLKEQSGRAVAVRHVQNLLSEGLAIFYCTPAMMREGTASGVYAAKLEKYRQDESALFAQAEKVLALSLNPHVDLDTCEQAFEAVAMDFDGILPVAHYLGARMVEVLDSFTPPERIIECVCVLPDFLPLYNHAARQTNAFVFDPSLVEQFSQMFAAKDAI